MEKEFVNVLLDAMGGDYKIPVNVKGALSAIKMYSDLKVTLVGKEDEIKKELSGHKFDSKKIDIINANDVITNEDTPTLAIKNKTDSSMVIGLNLIKENKFDGFVSAGSTGALLTGATLIVGRIKGVKRPALGTLLPNRKGTSFLIDCGANVDSKAEYLLQFAKMGSLYMENYMDVSKPTVGLVNVGEEKEKGNALSKEVYPLLEQSGLNFIGNIEARDIPFGKVDVVVCDAFVGNIILKLTEGSALGILKMVKDSIETKFIYKIGAFILKGAFMDVKKSMSYEKFGGAPFLGVKSLIIKAHGSSNEVAICQAINQCYKGTKNDLIKKMSEALEN